MIIDELTHDDIMHVIEHLHDYCASREYCSGCFYANDYEQCILKHIPAEWSPGSIKYRLEGGEHDD